MDFHSLLRRDLQFLCKKNKIPANLTNVAMADALKALEIVEGLEEFLNQTDSAAPQSPTSVAKELPSTARTAARTTQRKTTKVETQSVTRSCRLTRKSLAGEVTQENRNMNVLQSPAVPASRRKAATSVVQKSEINDGEADNNVKLEANVPKTPAARSTRRNAPAAASSKSKAPETKKNESVQQVYSTRRSVRLLENCLADLSLKPKEDLDEPVKNNGSEKELAAQEKDPEVSEAQGKSDDKSGGIEETEVIPGRNLSATMEKEWDMKDESLKDDNGSINSDGEIVDSEAQGDISVSKVKSETDEKMNELDSDNTEAEEKEFEAIQAFNSSVQVEDKDSSPAKPLSTTRKMIQGDDSEVSGQAASATSPVASQEILESANHEEINGKEDTPVSEDANMSINADTDSESEQCQSGGDDSEAETDWSSLDVESEADNIEVDPEEDNAGVDSNQEVFKSDAFGNDADCKEDSVPMSPTLDKLEDLEADSSSESAESEESETESDSEEDPEEDILSDADSNQAVFGSDVVVGDADEELEAIESEENENPSNKTEESGVTMSGKKIPTSPLPMSPFTAESISSQFPRPTLSTTPAKSSSKKKTASALKLTIHEDNENKNEENTESYSGRKAEKQQQKKKKKKNAVDEERLKDVSLRQLTKMVKEMAIKSNRTALQTLPNNQIAEPN